MRRTHIPTLSIFTLLGGIGAAQTPSAKSGCSLVTEEDAVTIVGPVGQKLDSGPNCVHGSKGPSAAAVALAVKVDSSPQVKELFTMPKILAAKASTPVTVKDEPGLSPGAYSLSMKGSQTIYMLKGSVALSITFGDVPGAKGVPDMLDKLRPIAKKALGRM